MKFRILSNGSNTMNANTRHFYDYVKRWKNIIKTIKWRNLLYARFVSIVIFESAYFPLCRYNKRKTAVAIYELQQPLLFNFIDDFSKNDLACAWVDIIHFCHPPYAVWWDHLLIKPVWQRIHRGEKDDRQFDDQSHRRLPQLRLDHRTKYEYPPVFFGMEEQESYPITA